MALEDLTGTNKYIANLVNTNPLSADDRREGDDHIRGIKNVLLNTFGALPGPANYVSKAGDTMTGALMIPTPTTGDRSTKAMTTDMLGNECANSRTATNGWQRLPGGLLLQWGSSVVTCDASGNAAVMYPLSFPVQTGVSIPVNGDSAIGHVVVSNLKSGGWPQPNGFAVNVRSGASGAAYVGGARIDWIAIGF